ncbi:MAG TPA: VCBS repeat-containing protein, partial [Chryseosolibacter sp.]|nr:VCBS repeat-containing protein [Chryseosolibacter sp.]
MPVSFFRNEDGKKFIPVSDAGLSDTGGWWKSITSGDFDNDGDVDYIAGNFGLNSHYRASASEPINVHFKDFDNNGAIEAITSYYEDGVNYPTASLDVVTAQLPLLKRRILYHRTYAGSSTNRLLEIAGDKDADVLYCKTLQSTYIDNSGGGKFSLKPLPLMMQTAPVYGIVTEDINADGNLDFIAVGNSYAPDVVSGRCDAFIGQVMLGDGEGNFTAMPVNESGFFVNGDAKGIVQLTAGGKLLTIVTQNNDSLKVFETKRTRPVKVLRLNRTEVAAVVVLKNGQSRRMEIGYGNSYLSQTSRSIPLNPSIKSIIVFDGRGVQTRKLDY